MKNKISNIKKMNLIKSRENCFSQSAFGEIEEERPAGKLKFDL